MNEPQIESLHKVENYNMNLLVQMHWIVRKMNGKTQNNKHGAHFSARFRDFGISMPDAGRERIKFLREKYNIQDKQQQHVAIK